MSTDPKNPAKHLLFLHIQKTAGSTFHNIIERQYPKDKIFSIYHTVNGVEAFQKLSPEKRNSLQLIKGHFPFGLHESLRGSSEYITVLRDPIDRTISHYHHAATDPEHNHYKNISQHKYSLSDVLEKGIMSNLDNNMVRMLSGDNRVDYGKCTQEMLEKANYNLENHFAIIGLQSRFDEFMLLCARRYDWKRFLYYRKANVRKERPAQEQFDAKTQDLLKHYNEFDQQLYAKWKPVIEKRIEDESSWLDVKLKEFRRKNARMNAWLGWWPKVLTP